MKFREKIKKLVWITDIYISINFLLERQFIFWVAIV